MSNTSSLLPWHRDQPFRYALWMLIAIVVCWQATLVIKRGWRTEGTPDRVTDFTAFYGAGRLALRGENIYDFKSSDVSRRPFLYPPTFAVFPMMPLALLPHNAALVVFTLLNYLLLFATFRFLRDALWRFVPQSDDPAGGTPAPQWRQWLMHPDTGILLAALVCFRFVDGNMRHGNSNMYVAFLLTLGLWAMLQCRKPVLEFSSGLAIALATAIKVTPGLFGLYMLWTWRKWGMLGGAVGLMVFLLFVPAVPMGFSTAVARLREYKAHMTTAATGEDAEEDPIGHDGGADQKQLEGGISLRGTLMRYLTPKPMKFVFKDKTEKLYYANFISMDESNARWICRGLELALLVVTVLLTMRTLARIDPAGIALSFALTTLAMLLISPLTRKAHLCALLIPAAVAIALIQQDRIRGFARLYCIASLTAICLHGAVFSVEFIGKLNSDRLQLLGLNCWMLLAIYLALARALWELQSGAAVPAGISKTPAPTTK